MITPIRYDATNTYLISGKNGSVLFDTGWAGTFPLLCKTLGEKKLRLQDINYLLISHFHPDHMGIAQQLANFGVTIAAPQLQREFLHFSDNIFERQKNCGFVPIDDSKVCFFELDKSREFLSELGISGEILHTPGHSDDSISLWLDDERALLVGDLPPLYELEMHKGTLVGESWDKLLALKPKTVYYAHAKTAELEAAENKALPNTDSDTYALVKKITKLVDKGYTPQQIQQKTGADAEFISDVSRIYVTHPGVSVQGILDRIEIKGM